MLLGAATDDDPEITSVGLPAARPPDPRLSTDPRDALVDRSHGAEPALIVKRGPSPGQRLVLHGETWSIGRSTDADILVDDITVSRRHATLERELGGGVCVKDEGSLNGTYVNGHRVDVAELRDGDELQIGSVKLIYVTARQ